MDPRTSARGRRAVPRMAGAGAAIVSLVLLAGCGSPSPTSSTTPAGTTAASAPASASAGGGPSVDASGVVRITSADVPMPAPVDPQLGPDAPGRIVSLATGVGETLAALGVADRVVGRDEASDVPAIESAQVVTKAHATSAEQVLALSPDLVLVDDATSPPEAIEQIRAAGIDVVQVPAAWSPADIAARVDAVARAVGAAPAAAQAVIAEATGVGPGPTTGSSAASVPRVAFLYLRGTAAIYLVGGSGSGADAMIAAAGATDAGAAAGLDAFVPLTAEALAALDPDVLLVMTDGLESVGGVDGLVQLPGVAQTRAGRERRVVAVDDTLLLSFGPRTGELARALGAAFAALDDPA